MGIEGTGQKAVASSTESRKYDKAVVNAGLKASDLVPQSAKQSASDGPLAAHSDPTRFGDWERAGRCIDF